MNNFMGLCQVVGRLVSKVEDDEVKRGFILQPSPSVFAKNQLDSRKGCKQEDVFKVSDAD